MGDVTPLGLELVAGRLISCSTYNARNVDAKPEQATVTRLEGDVPAVDGSRYQSHGAESLVRQYSKCVILLFEAFVVILKNDYL